MKQFGSLLLIMGAVILTSAAVAERLTAQQGHQGAVSQPHGQPALITIDYPAEGSIFPPEIPAPTFLWRDASERAKGWQIDVSFAGPLPACI